jgi:hypothetical protein
MAKPSTPSASNCAKHIKRLCRQTSEVTSGFAAKQAKYQTAMPPNKRSTTQRLCRQTNEATSGFAVELR